MLETAILRRIANPLSLDPRSTIPSIQHVQPFGDGLRIVVNSRTALVELATLPMAVEHEPPNSGGLEMVNVHLHATRPEIEFTTSDGMVVISMTSPQSHPPLSSDDFVSRSSEAIRAEPCSYVNAVACVKGQECDDSHGDPTKADSGLYVPERDPIFEFSRVLRALCAVLGNGRARYNAWWKSFELHPFIPGTWGVQDMAAALLLLGADPAEFRFGPRVINMGSLIISDAHPTDPATSEQREAIPSDWDTRYAELYLEVHRIGEDGRPRAGILESLPATLNPHLSADIKHWLETGVTPRSASVIAAARSHDDQS